MPTPGTCGDCGGLLTDERCLRCEKQSSEAFVHREFVILAALAGLTFVVFFVTRDFAAANQTQRLQDAKTWYAMGEQFLRTGDAEAALTALRRAIAKDPDAPSYRLALASVLIAADQEETARQVLLNLRERQPEDSETNLQLARLEARRGDRAAVGRYYQTAIVGLWESNQRQMQRQVRTEFIKFLLDHGEHDRALSELLVLEAGLPDDLSSQLAVGQMLLAAGDARRAGEHFAQALRLDPKNRLALAGAGESSFALGDYVRARQSFNRLDVHTERTRELHTLTELVLAADPLTPRLSMTERRRRLAAGLAQVIQRLDACRSRAPGVDPELLLADARGFEATLPTRNRPDAFDDVERGFELIYRSERFADRACGSEEPLDRALLLIGQRRGLEAQ
jgi:Tfp pilus assembly protein PilF